MQKNEAKARVAAFFVPGSKIDAVFDDDHEFN